MSEDVCSHIIVLELFLQSLSHVPTYDLFILFLPLTQMELWGVFAFVFGKSKREEKEESNQDGN